MVPNRYALSTRASTAKALAEEPPELSREERRKCLGPSAIPYALDEQDMRLATKWGVMLGSEAWVELMTRHQIALSMRLDSGMPTPQASRGESCESLHSSVERENSYLQRDEVKAPSLSPMSSPSFSGEVTQASNPAGASMLTPHLASRGPDTPSATPGGAVMPKDTPKMDIVVPAGAISDRSPTSSTDSPRQLQPKRSRASPKAPKPTKEAPVTTSRKRKAEEELQPEPENEPRRSKRVIKKSPKAMEADTKASPTSTAARTSPNSSTVSKSSPPRYVTRRSVSLAPSVSSTPATSTTPPGATTTAETATTQAVPITPVAATISPTTSTAAAIVDTAGTTTTTTPLTTPAPAPPLPNTTAPPTQAPSFQTPTTSPQTQPPKPFKCPHTSCTYSIRGFARQEHLNRHINTKHEKKIIVSCEDCGAGFTRKDNWMQHRRTCGGGGGKEGLAERES